MNCIYHFGVKKCNCSQCFLALEQVNGSHNFLYTMSQPREGDCDFDPDAMISSRESQSPKQGLQRASSAQESHHDKSYDILQLPPGRKSFHLHSQSMSHQNIKGESGKNLRLEMTQRPPTPPPSCSPQDDNKPDDSPPDSAPLAFSFFSPRNSFSQSDLNISRQRCSFGEDVAGSTGEKSFPSGEFFREEKEGIQSTFCDARKSTSALLVNPRRAPAPMSFKDESSPKPRIQQGYSVRRANLPRRNCLSDSHIVLQEETHDKALELAEIEVVQPDPGKNQDSNASNASKNTVKNPKTSSQGFKSSTPVKNFHLPATKEEENLETNDRAIECLSGTTGSSSKRMNEGVHVGEDNVESASTVTIDPSSAFMRRFRERRDEIEAETIALQGASRARDLNRLKKEEEKIMAWERKQIAKANEHMKVFERKLEKKRVKEMRNTQKKIAQAHKKAENKKVAKRAKFEGESVGVSSLVHRIRSGKVSWKCLLC